MPLSKARPARRLQGVKEYFMSTYYWLTPEEKQRKKRRNKVILYTSLLIFSVVLSALITILANQI